MWRIPSLDLARALWVILYPVFLHIKHLFCVLAGSSQRLPIKLV
jgi:hypothetical protein